MPTQDKVFEAIKSERDYQDRLWGPTETKGIHSVAEFVLFIEDYVAEARSQLSRNAGHQADEDALNTLRKVAALCVSAPRRGPRSARPWRVYVSSGARGWSCR